MLVDIGGVELYFDVEGPGLVAEGPQMQERPTLVLVPGGPGFDHSVFKPHYGELRDVVQVVYLDPRGTGRSARGDPSTWTLDVWAEDVKTFCDTVGIERPVVLGWSFGGMIALAYAERYPDHPSKLILQSTMARFDLERIVAAFRAFGDDCVADAARAFWGADPPDFTAYLERCLPLYGPNPVHPDLFSRSRSNFDLLNNPAQTTRTRDLRPDLGSIACPTLVLAGELDPMCGPLAADEILAGLRPGVGHLEQFAQSGHSIDLDEPAHFFEVLRTFLRNAPI